MNSETIIRLNELQKQFQEINDHSAILENQVDSLVYQLKKTLKGLACLEIQEQQIDIEIEEEKEKLLKQTTAIYEADFDLLTSVEKDRLVLAISDRDEVLVEWLLTKKKSGISFGDIKNPLQSLMSEDYEEFVAKYKKTDRKEKT